MVYHPSAAEVTICRESVEGVEVWWTTVAVLRPWATAWWATLSADEMARARRYRRPSVGERFALARGWLRAVLADYTGCAPASLHFVRGAHGKPALMHPADGPPFNLAHADALIVCAVASQGEVGVDVERVRPLAGMRLAARYFSARERAALERLSPAEQKRAFFRLWVRKEAYSKARGQGLALPLTAFDVTVTDAPPRLLADRCHPHDAGQWSLRDLMPPHNGYVAALAWRTAPIPREATPPIGKFPPI